ncbi:MAG: Membrane-bound lytic murein transglycosylase D precursor [Candidatus Ozemobacter sibiricus]|jgi:tetratricopeptide (TPR) repeat protein|uniref:Membrane-bound lytic murein transglycosylase D n=1 Tax=Candidatus Ozemobacter sibiricus TaxID=2268124 RepID=A0A367ZT68_9BACT|nr:MAG: Membrane-bound lytic murein transglycosylase D precursor [Candidatus Ozemobacter sibiricus]
MLCLLLIGNGVAHGAIYSYRDEKGRLFLTDNPPNKKYKIVVTTKKDRADPDIPTSGGGTLQILTEMAPQKILLPNDETFSTYINQAARMFGLDPYLIKSVVKVESDFDPSAVSSKGAQGLMQLIPSTARLVGCFDPFDPFENIKGGARYLRMMLDRFEGNLEHALAAYNAGPGRVEQYRGVPPFRETRNYVKKVQHYYAQYRAGLPEARPLYRKTVKAMPVAPSALSQKLTAAYRLYQNQDIDGAIRAYQDILNIYPRNTQALYNLACLLDSERRYDEAIDAYRAALREDPYLDKALYNLAIIYERLGQHQEAIATWRNYMLATKDEEKLTMAERYVKELEEYAALGH